MNLRPGSVPWFLRHELRLFWIGTFALKAKGSNGRKLSKLSLFTLAGSWLIIHALAYALLLPLDGNLALPPRAIFTVTLVVLVVFMFMLSNGLKASVEALFERGDLDLLLSSPLPSLSIFTARLIGITLYSTALYLFFLAPFAHAGLALGKFHLLGIYPAVLGMGAIAASMAMLLTLGLVRFIGARRTRVVAQVLGALAGAFIFLASQGYSMISSSGKQAVDTWVSQASSPGGLLAPDSSVWLPARAVLGETRLLLWLGLAAAVILFVTIRLTHRFFVRGLQLAASSSRAPARARKQAPYRFRNGLFEVTVIKEWRLVWRDPHLISQLLLQLLYLLPLLFLLFTNPRTSLLPGMGAGLVLLSSSLSGSLAWLTVAAEDAPDLLLASPANQRMLRLAKLAAAAMPPLLLVALPLLWLLLAAPLSGLLLSFPLVAAILSTVMIVQWRKPPAARSDFSRRGMGDWLGNLLETFNGMGWAALAYVLVLMGSGAQASDTVVLAGMVALAVVLTLPATAWLTRRRPA